MNKIRMGTREEYDNIDATFTEKQKSKPRTRKYKANTFKQLQKEYNMWVKDKRRMDTIYFVTD